METTKLVTNRLQYLCSKRGFSINKLANISGISPSTLKSILYGKSKNPGVVTLKILCDGLDITLAEFFDTEEFNSLEQEIE